MTEAQDDYETLMAQMEREYEEAEQKKKAEKKSKKKAGKQDEEAGEAKPAPVKEEKKPKKAAAKKAEPKDEETEKPVEKTLEKLTLEEKKEPATDNSKKNNKKKDTKDTKVEPQPATDKKEKKDETPAAETKKKGNEKAGAKKKGPGALLKEALAKVQEQEEEMKRKEEERLRQEEEARRQKQEQERLEKERKERKKQKEKERIKRLKEEGKYETKEQKEARQRALLQLQAMGVKIPAKTGDVKPAPETEKPDQTTTDQKQLKKPKYERIRKNKQSNQTEGAQQEQQEDEEEQKLQEEAREQKELEVKESWDMSEEEIKDEWDADSDTDKASTATKKSKASTTSGVSTATTTTTKTATTTVSSGDKKVAEEEEESEEDESEEESETESESESDEDKENADLPPMERVRLRIQKRHEEAEKLRTTDDLRCPVICVLGHVDTGKTKILDNLRRTRVQEDEAGGITQQIGATNVPFDTIKDRTKMCTHLYKNLLKVPGFLIIDTPGHESFKSLRTRGSSLCDIAILVVDIMHGLEPQTIESINILKDRKTPFIVALNKIDRLFGWKTAPNKDIVEVLESQDQNVKNEFETRSNEAIVQLAEQGLNAQLFYKNQDTKTYISIVPTSAHTSDGIGNLMALIVEFSQTILAKRVSYSTDLQCTVMEVKAIPGLGTTIDVCLVNGKLKVCDTIVIAGQEGPIVTSIRGLLTPQPNRDLRVKNNYVMNKELKGASGVKIAAKDLEKCMAGLPLFVAHRNDEIEYYKEELNHLLKQALSSIKLSDTGVFVQASTLGSLEALLEFLRTSKIPYAGISIGPVHKKDVTMASIMLEKDPQYAVILAFDVKVERDAQDMADHVGVKVFTADIIYHLFDKFIGYRDELKQKKREEFKDVAVFPFKLKILPEFIFNTRDPIIVGVKIEAGFVKMNSPVCAMCEDPNAEREGKEKFVDLGRITSIEYNHKPLEVAKQGQEVCIKIENTTGGAPKLLGRHFLQSDLLVSKISRESIDAVKNYFREEMTKSDWQLIIELKKQFNIF